MRTKTLSALLLIATAPFLMGALGCGGSDSSDDAQDRETIDETEDRDATDGTETTHLPSVAPATNIPK